MINPDAKHPCIYDDDNVTLYLEMSEEIYPFIHCTVHKWTHNTLREFKNIWTSVLNTFKKKGYKEIYAPDMDDKITRFAKMFGFRKIEGQILGEDLKVRGVLKCQMED